MPNTVSSQPKHQQIRDFVISKIQQGVWEPGDMIPTEQQLCELFSVARMTVNRALSSLVAEGFLVRQQGSGTFVAPQKYKATVLEIRNIADEIKERGHAHRALLYRLERVSYAYCQPNLRLLFGISREQELFHSMILHCENDVPIQLEDRWVNPKSAPDYLQQNFSDITPNAYLLQVAPLESAQFSIEAGMPPADIAAMLQLKMHEPCLVVQRETYSKGVIVSIATLWHPSSRYQLTGCV